MLFLLLLLLMLAPILCSVSPLNKKHLSVVNCTIVGETILEAGDYVKFETMNYPYFQPFHNAFTCYHKFKREDKNLNLWFVFFNGEISYFDITGLSSNSTDYERKTIIWDKQPSWFSTLMKWSEMEFHVGDYNLAYEAWEGFQAIVYAPLSISNTDNNPDCPLNGINFTFSNTLDIIPITSSYYYPGKLNIYPINSTLSCKWTFKNSPGFMFKVHIKQLEMIDDMLEAISLNITLDDFETVEVTETGVYYFNNSIISINYEVRSSNFSTEFIGFGGIVTAVAENPSINNNCSISWDEGDWNFQNTDLENGYPNNQFCETQVNIIEEQTFQISYDGYLEDGVDKLLAIDSLNNTYDITQNEKWVIDNKAKIVSFMFISDGSLTKAGFVVTGNMLSCNCSKQNQTISIDSGMVYFTVTTNTMQYCSKMNCTFNLLLKEPNFPVMLIPILNLRPNSNDIIIIYKNHTMYANITADAEIVNHYIFEHYHNDVQITFESDEKLFGIYPAPYAAFNALAVDGNKLIIDLTSSNFMFTLDLSRYEYTKFFTVNAPNEFTLDFFFVGGDLTNNYLLEKMFLYDSNATENYINALSYLPRHKIYNEMRYYTSTSNSLTLFSENTISLFTLFFRLREIHAENCESFDNVVTVSNSTIKAKSSNNGSCYLTVLNWNDVNSLWCQSQYLDLMTDSLENVKFVPDIEQFQSLLQPTDYSTVLPEIKNNYTFFEFNNETVQTWSRLFFYGLSNACIIPPDATLSFKSMRYTGAEGYDENKVMKGILTSNRFVDPTSIKASSNSITIPPRVTCQFKIIFLDLSSNGTLYLYIENYYALKNVTKVNETFEFAANTKPVIVHIELNDTNRLYYKEYYRGYVIEFQMIPDNPVTTITKPSTLLTTSIGTPISTPTLLLPGGGESAKWWIIGSAVMIIITIMISILVLCLRRKYYQRKFNEIQEAIRVKMEMSPLEVKLSHDERLTKQLDPKSVVIDFDTILGKGANATVYKVFLKGTMKSNLNENKKLKFATQIDENSYAALKLPTSFDQDEVEQFVRELDALIKLGSHFHIISFLGWTLYHDIPALVTELANTNFLQYVKNFRGEVLPIKTIISILLQISQALEHLASLNMVHRDVACRNILLTENNIAKLADFGLCCHCDESFTYQATIHKRLPIKWLSIEALTERIFSEKSDVWAFGILCYEIFSYGSVPYATMTNEEMLEFLQAGNRLEKPNGTPDSIYFLMLDCWKMDPNDRPKFEAIENILRTNLENETASYGYLTLGDEE